MAQVLDRAEEAEAFVEDGPMPALPVYGQFLEAGGPLRRLHQAVQLEAPQGLIRDQAAAALSGLLAHHGALRCVRRGRELPRASWWTRCWHFLHWNFRCLISPA